MFGPLNAYFLRLLLLRPRRDELTDPLFIAAITGEVAQLELALQMAVAAAGGEGDPAELLDINKADSRFGLTPLLMACRNGHFKIALQLLNYGAGRLNLGVALRGGGWLSCWPVGFVQVLAVFLPPLTPLPRFPFFVNAGRHYGDHTPWFQRAVPCDRLRRGGTGQTAHQKGRRNQHGIFYNLLMIFFFFGDRER